MFWIYDIIHIYIVMIEDTAVQAKEETAAESLSTRRSSSCCSSSGSGGDVELGGEVVGWSSYDDDAEQRLLWETKVRCRHWSLID